MNNMERANTRKRNTINSSVLSVKITFILFKCHRFINNSNDSNFLSCHEEAHDNKEFGQENSKPPHESQIMTC